MGKWTGSATTSKVENRHGRLRRERMVESLYMTDWSKRACFACYFYPPPRADMGNSVDTRTRVTRQMCTNFDISMVLRLSRTCDRITTLGFDKLPPPLISDHDQRSNYLRTRPKCKRDLSTRPKYTRRNTWKYQASWPFTTV
jgi:hypothetical protein